MGRSPNDADPVVDSCRQAVAQTFQSICQVKPEVAGQETAPPEDRVTGTISFTGDRAITLAIGADPEGSAFIARKFAGVPVEYSSDMMNAIMGEIANIIAGELVSSLDRSGCAVRMGLPSVERGSGSTSAMTPWHALALENAKVWFHVQSDPPGS